MDSESTVRASPSNEEEDLPSLLNSLSPPSNTSTLWSPSVFRFHTEELTRRITETVLLNPRESMSNETEADKLTRLISLMVAGQAESMKAAQLEREQRREDEARRIDAQREDEARRLLAQREEDARREERLLLALRETRTVAPQAIIVQSQKLPKMHESDDVETFLELFEAALRVNEISPDLWKRKLHAQLPNLVKVKIQWVLQDDRATYDQIKETLLGCAEISFGVVAEAFKTAEKGKLTTMTPRTAADKMRQWAGKITQGASSESECSDLLVTAEMRHWLVPELQSYVDLAHVKDLKEFVKVVEGWESSQPTGTPCFRHMYSNPQSTQYSSGRFIPYPSKRSFLCYHCNKPGHISKDCRSRLAADRPLLTPSTSEG